MKLVNIEIHDTKVYTFIKEMLCVEGSNIKWG